MRRDKRIPWGAVIVILAGILVIFSSIGLGIWAAYKAIHPWAGSVSQIRQLEIQGPTFYKPTPYSDHLYCSVQQAFTALENGFPDEALSLVSECKKQAPENPLFDYLEALIYFRKDNKSAMIKAMNSGNSKGVLYLYFTDNTSPDKWNWPEVDSIRFIGKRMVIQYADDRNYLETVLIMGHKLALCEPSDPMKVVQGIEVRETAATHLLIIAAKDRDNRLANLCKELIEEGQLFRKAVRRSVDLSDPFHGDSRIWVIGKAVQKQAPEFRDAAMLLYLEKQAGRAEKMRRDYLKVRKLEELKN